MNQVNTPVSRPALLTALCALTFIGSTAGFIGYFLAALFFEQATKLIVTYSSWHSTGAISPLYFTLFMVLNALSLTGAIRIWKFHRDGFYLYFISQVMIVLLPALWINWQALSSTNAIFTLVFLTGYALNLKWLR